ncbi:MAG: hypothetical protein V3S95_07500 [Alphaproteobacteria bacterium]
MTRTAFGLDLAGYSAVAKAKLVRILERDDATAEATLLDFSVFNKKHHGNDEISAVAGKEVSILEKCITTDASLFVDVPIDLQDLPPPHSPQYIWQLQFRSVDRAFEGMAPLASRLGAPVARFKNLLELAERNLNKPALLGKMVFETYPAASLKLVLGQEPKSYKNCQTKYIGAEWVPFKWPKTKKADETGLHDVANKLHLSAPDESPWSDDEIDAVICAMAGVVGSNGVLKDETLKYEIKNSLQSQGLRGTSNQFYEPPVGYVLVKNNPFSEIRLRRLKIAADVDWAKALVT